MHPSLPVEGHALHFRKPLLVISSVNEKMVLAWPWQGCCE